MINYGSYNIFEYNNRILLNGINSNNYDVNSIKRIKLPEDFLEVMKDKIYYLRVEDNTRLDIISFNEYKTTDYAYLIMLLNKFSSVYNLPRDVNYIAELANETYEEYTSTTILSDVEKDIVIKQIENKLNTQNELYRNLILPKESYITDIIEYIKDYNNVITYTG